MESRRRRSSKVLRVCATAAFILAFVAGWCSVSEPTFLPATAPPPVHSEFELESAYRLQRELHERLTVAEHKASQYYREIALLRKQLQSLQEELDQTVARLNGNLAMYAGGSDWSIESDAQAIAFMSKIWQTCEATVAFQTPYQDFENLPGIGGTGQAMINDIHKGRMSTLGYPWNEPGRVAYALEVLYPEQGVVPWINCARKVGLR